MVSKGELFGMPASRPLVGDTVNDIESGILASWFRNSFEQYPIELFPVLPEFVGHRPPRVVLGKQSGLDSVAIWAERLGIELTEQETKKILTQVKLRSLNLKRLLTEDEFRKMAQCVRAKERKGNLIKRLSYRKRAKGSYL